jgi:hypothetical protein
MSRTINTDPAISVDTKIARDPPQSSITPLVAASSANELSTSYTSPGTDLIYTSNATTTEERVVMAIFDTETFVTTGTGYFDIRIYDNASNLKHSQTFTVTNTSYQKKRYVIATRLPAGTYLTKVVWYVASSSTTLYSKNRTLTLALYPEP